MRYPGWNHLVEENTSPIHCKLGRRRARSDSGQIFTSHLIPRSKEVTHDTSR